METVSMIKTTWGNSLMQLVGFMRQSGNMQEIGEGTIYAENCDMNIHRGTVGA